MKPFKALFTTHLVEFIIFFTLTIFIFVLPQTREPTSKIASDFDIFYKFLFNKFLDIVTENYIFVGSVTLGLSFGALISTLIAHAGGKRFLFFNTVYSILLIPIFPIGTMFAFFTFPQIHDARKREDDQNLSDPSEY